MFWVPFALAAPVDSPPAPQMKESELRVRSRSAPRLPKDKSGLSVCVVDVLIDTKGKPESATARDCGPGFAAESERTILRWRWEPPKLDGERVRARTLIKVVFKVGGKVISGPPTVSKHLALEPPRQPGQACVVEATVRRDGTVDMLRSNAPTSCVTRPGAGLPERHWKRIDGRTACTVGFDTRRGMLTKERVEECPEDLQEPTLRLARGWAWAHPYEPGTMGEPEQYEFTVIYEP